MGEKLRVTLVIDKTSDAEVADWVLRQRNMSAAIIERLRAAIVPRDPVVDLSAIRQIVEAALDTKLAGLALAAGPRNGDAPEGENPVLGARLDSMFPEV